jgi:hypothetical protein
MELGARRRTGAGSPRPSSLCWEAPPAGRYPYEEATVLGAENSEVLPAGLVAVAVTVRPAPTFWAGEKVKEALPDPSVVTLSCPMKVLPSSPPQGLEKNRTAKVLFGVLLRTSLMVVLRLPVLAESMTGLFWRSLGPVSASPGSLVVGPSSPRSIPRPPFEKMEFYSRRLPVASSPKTLTPLPALAEMTLRSPAEVPQRRCSARGSTRLVRCCPVPSCPWGRCL